MGVFIGLRANALSQLDAVCPAHVQCPASVATSVADGRTYSTLANVFGVIGGAAAVAGAVLLLTPSAPLPRAQRQAPSQSASPDPPARPAAWIQLGAGGMVALGGTF
jgi:hypothetical protein